MPAVPQKKIPHFLRFSDSVIGAKHSAENADPCGTGESDAVYAVTRQYAGKRGPYGPARTGDLRDSAGESQFYNKDTPQAEGVKLFCC